MDKVHRETQNSVNSSKFSTKINDQRHVFVNNSNSS